MAYTENDFQNFKERELKPNDTFQFECAMCGNCCRCRSEPIILTGPDVFRIARALNTSILDVMGKNTHGNIGGQSHVPVITLAERLDGSCRLLRRGKCMVHKDKPAVCALYPLGRYFDAHDNSYHYFMNEHLCGNGTKAGRTWTLQEWLDEFHIEESINMTAVWHKLLMGIVNVTHRIEEQKIHEEFVVELLALLYLNYDISKPYIPQVEQNMGAAKQVFSKRFHIKLKF